MGALLHPVGSRRVGVYWARRALVLVVVVAIIVGIVWLAHPRAGSSGTGDVPTSAPMASPNASGLACDPASVTLAVAGFQKLAVSGHQTFSLSVTNTGKTSCALDVSPSTYTLTVTSGSDRIWSTADCGTWLPSQQLMAAPGDAYQFTVTWPLTRSSATCQTSKAPLKPGTYVATATWGTGASPATARQVIQLTA